MGSLPTALFLILHITFCSGKGGEWNYGNGEKGPSGWGSVARACAPESARQSPIDFSPQNTLIDPTIPEFRFHNYDRVLNNLEIVNNGHSVQVSIPKEKQIKISGGGLIGTYSLIQFHFHWSQRNYTGSEHTTSKLHYPLEAHFVHTKDGYEEPLKQPDGLAVIGVFFHLSNEESTVNNEFFNPVQDILKSGAKSTISGIRPIDLTPKDKSRFWRYLGSLTTPPCSEAVVWTVMSQSLPITNAQLNILRQVEGNGDTTLEKNYRPIQSLKKRVVLLRTPPRNILVPPMNVLAPARIPTRRRRPVRPTYTSQRVLQPYGSVVQPQQVYYPQGSLYPAQYRPYYLPGQYLQGYQGYYPYGGYLPGQIYKKK